MNLIHILMIYFQIAFFTNNRNIISGDFNIILLEHVWHPPTNSSITMMQSNNYFPHISQPTRFPNINVTAVLPYWITSGQTSTSLSLLEFFTFLSVTTFQCLLIFQSRIKLAIFSTKLISGYKIEQTG